MNSKRFFALFLTLTMLTTAGCGVAQPAAQPKAPEAEQPKAPEPKKTIKTSMATGGKSAIVYLPPAIAEYSGFFKDEALDIEVSDAKGGADAAKALIGGSADFASMALDHAIKAKVQGSDLVLVAVYTRFSGVSLVVNSKLKDKVKSVQDLKGMKIGVSSLGSGTHLALTSLLVKSGMKATDVEVLAVGTTTMVPAMQNGSIDAAMHVDPFVTQLVSDGSAYLLFDLATEKDTLWLYGSEYPFTGLVTRKEVVDKNPELVQRMVNAIYKANQFVHANEAKALAAVLPKEYQAGGELYVKALAHSKPALSPTGLVSIEAVQTVIKALLDSGSLPAGSTVDPKSIIDMSFLQKASGK